MPTYVLDGSSEVLLHSAPLTVHLRGASNPDAFRLVALSNGLPVPGVIAPTSGMLVVPAVSGRVVLSVIPTSGHVFSEGSLVSITVASDDRGNPDPERVVVGEVNVSGLSSRDLLVLESRGDFLAASSYGKSDEPLGTLASRARAATREVLGVEQVDATSAINIVAAIDGSASMLAVNRDGTIEAILDVLVGMAEVVAPGRKVEAAVITDTVIWLPATSPSALAQTARSYLDETPLSSAFVSGHAGLVGRAPTENTVTYLITDGVPADLSALCAADEIDGEARHLVAIIEGRALALQDTSTVNTTRLDDGSIGEALADRLDRDRAELRQLVSSLLKGCFVPGTDYAKRVAS